MTSLEQSVPDHLIKTYDEVTLNIPVVITQGQGKPNNNLQLEHIHPLTQLTTQPSQGPGRIQRKPVSRLALCACCNCDVVAWNL